MKKAELKSFLSQTDRMLLDNNFRRTVVSDRAGIYEWIKETKYGILFINPDNDFPSKIYSIFGRFDDPDKAKEILSLTGGNTYSGKCNFHVSDKENILRQFKNFLKLID